MNKTLTLKIQNRVTSIILEERKALNGRNQPEFGQATIGRFGPRVAMLSGFTAVPYPAVVLDKEDAQVARPESRVNEARCHT